jgi:hypothetical protein
MKRESCVSKGAPLAVLLLAWTATLPGCVTKKEGPPPVASVAGQLSASAVPPAAPVSPPGASPSVWQVPSGPRLGIIPGQGVGPIRLGATVATIERHMQAPCEFKTEEACRYVGRALEFLLTDGITTEIRVHRKDRATTPKPRAFGIFNGHFMQGAQFFMLPFAVHEMLGKPRRIEAVADGGEWNTAEVHHYDDMRLEFDRIENGNLVLGGVIIRKSGASAPPGQSSSKNSGSR